MKRGPVLDPDRLHSRIMASAGGSHPAHEPAHHAAMTRFDKSELIRGAVELERAGGGFEVDRGDLGENPDPLVLVAVYGDGQQFYFTRDLTAP